MRDVLVDRLQDYRASVLRCGPEDVAATAAAALDSGLGAGWAAADVVVAPGLPVGWRPAGASEDDGRPATDLAAYAATVTGVAIAIARSCWTGRPCAGGGPCPCCRTAWSAS